VRSSGDKLCGRGLIWPKSGAGGAGFGWHVSGFDFTVFMETFSHFYQDLPAEKPIHEGNVVWEKRKGYLSKS
jgi:hypothetical protein